MTQAELIEKASAYVKEFEKEKDAVEALTKTRFREAAIIYFGAEDRDDYFEVVVDRETGEFIGATYFPKD
jgi:hypothetical protein